MKLHLPTSLRRSLLVLLQAALPLTCAGIAEAAYQHQDVSIKTYTDFGQNKGRYVVGNTNALLQYLNQDGVKITYTGGQEAYTMEHGMIDFDSQVSSGEAAAIGYNFIATVAHVPVVDEHYNNGLMDFTRNNLGRSNSVLYTGIEYAAKDGNSSFQLKPNVDYKITRLSKLVTDVIGSTVYGSADGDYSLIDGNRLAGELLYRSGSGHMYKTNADGTRTWCANPYTYITGGIDTISGLPVNSSDGSYSVNTYFTYTGDEVGKSEPLPYKADQGDSGSPSWVWNENTQQYEYIAALQSGNEWNYSQFRGNAEWTNETMASFDVNVTMASGNAIYLNAITGVGESFSDSGVGASTTLRYGLVTDDDGNELALYNGVVSGTNTWKNLAELKDTSNWYNYGDKYLNATKESSASASLTWADLYYNDNLVIAAASATESQQVVLNDTVDLGIGYVQFSLGQGMESADFVVTSEGKESNLLNSAGFVVDKGVSLHMQLTNPADYMREWRKVGEGSLYIEGSGNNDIFLNIGGDGTTYLQREDGYAAYNVLVNNGSTIVIDDINQIKRDLTFGNRGGELDMNGNSMEWNNDDGAGAEGFTVHALDEGAVIANRAEGTHSEVRWTQGGEQTWLGSFVDTISSSLSFIYDAAEAGSRLTLRSILTKLSNAASRMMVENGTVVLEGSNTVHALGSNGSWNSSARYSSAEDWHYADAQMNVSVANGATFELGSHARLTGDVTVASGGTYIMHEGVKHRWEFIEGGYEKEDTNAIRAFFGHKGNVSLAKDATMRVSFSEGTDSTLIYSGNITGEGNVWVDAQSGILQLGGMNSFSGTKNFTAGGLRAESNAALGDTTTNKWVIEEKAWLASDGFTDATQILTHIDSSSKGVLALSQNVEGQIDLSGHTGLIIGAAEGCNVRYGTESESLNAIGGQWVLGGGGGNLEVAFKLSGQNNLVLGNAYGKGNVHLSNSNNDFSGDVRFVGGVTLTYDDGALGNAKIDLSYRNRALLSAADISKVKSASMGVSQGVVLVDRMLESDLDLSSLSGLALGSSGDVTYSGNIVLAEGNPYRFGGGDGCLTVDAALNSGCDMVIDGQGYTGGSVVLANAQNFSGTVSVMGFNPAMQVTSGDVTLRFVADNAMTSAGGFIINSGGKLDLAGTNQQLAGVQLSNGSIIDSSEGKNSTLTITSGTLGAGTVEVAHIVKAGTGTLTLSNSTNFADFAVAGGTLKLGAAAKGSFRVEGSGIMDMSGYDATGTLTLGAGARLQNVVGLSAALQVQGDSTLMASSRGSELSSAISVAAGTELAVQGGSASFSLGKLSSLSGEGNVSISTSSANGYGDVLIQGNNSSFSGRLSVSGSGNNVVSFAAANAMGTGTVALDNVIFLLNDTGSSAAAALAVGTRGVAYRDGSGSEARLSGLSGSGTLRAESYYSGGSLWFGGDVSGFTGTLDNAASTTSFRYGFGGDGVSYHTLTGNASAEAAALFGEGVELNSSAGTATYEFRYTDKVALNAAVGGNANVTQSGTGTLLLGSGHTSTGTLSINAGSVELAEGSSWAGALAGTGTLINRSTQAVTISSASNFSGNLELMQGSTLSLGADGSESFSLGAGQHLSVLAGAAESVDSAYFKVSSLVLNGGELSFSGESLKQGGGALLSLYDSSSGKYRPVLRGDAGGTQTTISFYDTSGLALGVNSDKGEDAGYTLVQGNLTDIANNTFIASGLDDCFEATFTVTGNNRVLIMTLAARDGHSIWVGNAAQNTWTSGFDDGSAPSSTDSVWFNDTAAVKDVSISGTQSATALIFNATQDYSLSTTTGATLSAGSLELRNSGKVTLGSGVYISGNSSLAAGSELEVKSFGALRGTVSGAEATLTVDAGSAQGSFSLGALDTLRLLSGTYEASDDVSASTIEAVGGLLYLKQAKDYTSELVLGNGGTEAALLVQASGRTNLNGDISLAADTAVNITMGETLFNAKLSGNNHTITKQGAGRLWLATAGSGGFSTEDVAFVINEGELRLGGTTGKGIPVGISSITMKADTTLGFCANSSELGSALVLEGGSTLHLSNGAGKNDAYTYTFTGEMNLSGGEVKLTTEKSRKLVLDGDVSGLGGLKIDSTTALEVVLNQANSFEGGVNISTSSSGATLSLSCAEAAGTGSIVLGNAASGVKVQGNSDGSFGNMVNAISGAGSVEVLSGQLTMSGSNSYGGTTTVKSGAALKLTGSNSGSASYVVEKEAQLLLAGEGFATTAGKSVTLSAASSAKARATTAEGVLENVTVTDESMTPGTIEMMGSVRGALVSIEARAYAISGIEFENSRVQVNTEGTALSLSDLVLDSSTTLTGVEDVTMSLQNVTLAVDAPVTYDLSKDYGLVGSTVATCTLQNFANVSLTGDVTFNAASWTAPMEADYLAVDFGDSVDVSELRATVTFADGLSLAAIQSSQPSVLLFSMPAKAIPEPTTSALALLGLGALALRRRRK